jgi:hypothetical protein
MSGYGASRHLAAVIGRFRCESDISKQRLQKPDLLALVPRDDLVLALMNIRRVEQIAAATPH